MYGGITGKTFLDVKRWVPKKFSHLAFDEYFCKKSNASSEEFFCASDIRFYLFGKGILPEGFSYKYIRPFFKFWLKSLLEEERRDGDEEVYRVLVLGAVGVLFDMYEDDERWRYESEEEELKRLRRIERIKSFKEERIGCILSFFPAVVSRRECRGRRILSLSSRESCRSS